MKQKQLLKPQDQKQSFGGDFKDAKLTAPSIDEIVKTEVATITKQEWWETFICPICGALNCKFTIKVRSEGKSGT